jgi:type I restriction enzyme R subunit
MFCGEDGKPLAVVEAKRTTVDVQQGKRQAELYADCLQQDSRFGGRRPLIYFTNGYEIFFWDDLNYVPRKVQGFLSRDEMQRLIDRRELAQSLNNIEIDTSIAGYKRPYQQQAIRAVCEQFDQQRRRKALLVMATGTGKTRTIIGLLDLLMRGGG